MVACFLKQKSIGQGSNRLSSKKTESEKKNTKWSHSQLSLQAGKTKFFDMVQLIVFAATISGLSL